MQWAPNNTGYNTMKPEINMRVHVFSPDKSEDWGLGTITDIVALADEDTGEVFTYQMPEITTDEGRTMIGLDCWWHPVEEV